MRLLAALALLSMSSVPVFAATASELVNQGITHYNAGACDKAVPLFKEAIQKDPKAHRPYALLGECHRRLKQFKLSYDAWKQLVDMSVDKAKAFSEFKKGVLDGIGGLKPTDEKAAKAFADLGYKAYPGDAEIKAKLAGNPAPAAPAPNAPAAGGKSAKDLVSEGIGFYNSGKCDQAVPLFQEAIKKEPKEHRPYALLGECQRRLKQYKQSYDAWATLVGLSVDKAKSFSEFKKSVVEGVDGLRLTDAKAAKAFGDLGLKGHPNDADIKAAIARIDDPTEKAVNDGIAKLNTGKQAEADKLFEQALKTAKDHKAAERIAAAFTEKVKSLSYDKQMSSPLQDRVVYFHHAAVKKYFELNKYTQKLTSYPPFATPFCVYQGAGGKSFHYGVNGHYSWDLATCNGEAMGVPIVAIADGVVKSVEQTNADNAKNAPVNLNAKANMIVVTHGDVESHYVHIKKNSAKVQVGNAVKRGQVLAEVGNSGVTSGPHLHFAVRKKDEQVTVPVSFTGMYSGGKNAKAGAQLTSAKLLEEGKLYSSKNKL